MCCPHVGSVVLKELSRQKVRKGSYASCSGLFFSRVSPLFSSTCSSLFFSGFPLSFLPPSWDVHEGSAFKAFAAHFIGWLKYHRGSNNNNKIIYIEHQILPISRFFFFSCVDTLSPRSFLPPDGWHVSSYSYKFSPLHP